MISQSVQDQALEIISKAREIIELGLQQFNEGDLQSAIENFEKALEINPTSVPSALYLSLCKFAIISERNNLQTPLKPEVQKHLRDIVITLENVCDQLNYVLDL